MPEIVSSERILAKLKQFDDRLSDAISASESSNRIEEFLNA